MEIAKEQLSRNHRDEVRHHAHMKMTPLGNAVGFTHKSASSRSRNPDLHTAGSYQILPKWKRVELSKVSSSCPLCKQNRKFTPSWFLGIAQPSVKRVPLWGGVFGLSAYKYVISTAKGFRSLLLLALRRGGQWTNNPKSNTLRGAGCSPYTLFGNPG
jgi:hypothetical protein